MTCRVCDSFSVCSAVLSADLGASWRAYTGDELAMNATRNARNRIVLGSIETSVEEATPVGKRGRWYGASPSIMGPITAVGYYSESARTSSRSCGLVRSGVNQLVVGFGGASVTSFVAIGSVFPC